jgi:hypothetical protein
MEYPLGRGCIDGGLHSLSIAQVCLVDGKGVADVIETPRVRSGPKQQIDAVALGEEAVRQAGANEAGGAGQEHPACGHTAAGSGTPSRRKLE